MWSCPQCNEQVEPPFDACWNCGTACGGEIDLRFRHADSIPKEELRPSATAPPSLAPLRFQFRLSSLMLLTTLACFGAAWITPLQWLAFVLFVVAWMMFGALAIALVILSIHLAYFAASVLFRKGTHSVV